MTKYKAQTLDGQWITGNIIRYELLGCWMIHEKGETKIDPSTIEELDDGEEQ